MHKYIFDITALRGYLARHSHLSGIQRASIMTMIKADKLLGAEHVYFGYHDRITDTYKVYPCPADSSYNLANYTALCEVFQIPRPLPKMEKYAQTPLKRRWKIWWRDFQAKWGNQKYFQRRGLSLEEWQSTRAKLSRSNVNERLEDIARPGDRLILLDNAWLSRRLEPWLKHARMDLELQVYVLLHDLIPLVTPQYVEGDICNRFYGWLMRSVEYVTCYLANSENTGQDILTFLNSQNATQPIKVVPLAQDMLMASPSTSVTEGAYTNFMKMVIVPDYIRAITKTPYVLVVGTMEVRKNIWQLATVWDRLRQQTGRSLPKLVFAGRRGWLNDDFDRLMQTSGQIGGWVEIVASPDDDILAFLYRNCLFTITTSFYEGWGLPIGESLAYGKTAVVSNTSSMPEVGGDMVEYCDPHSLDSIEAACLRLIDDPDHRTHLEERIANTHLRSWDDVAHDMLEAVRVS